MEAICIGIFVAEISARVWSAPTVGYYFRDFMNWIDIAAVVPFFVDLGVSSGQIPGLQVVRVLRLTRAMRLLKLSQTHLRGENASLPCASTLLRRSHVFRLLASLAVAQRGPHERLAVAAIPLRRPPSAVLGKAMKLSLPVLYMLLLLLMMVMVLFGTLVWFVNHGELSEIVEMWTQRNAYVCDVKVLRTLPTGDRLA